MTIVQMVSSMPIHLLDQQTDRQQRGHGALLVVLRHALGEPLTVIQCLVDRLAAGQRRADRAPEQPASTSAPASAKGSFFPGFGTADPPSRRCPCRPADIRRRPARTACAFTSAV